MLNDIDIVALEQMAKLDLPEAERKEAEKLMEFILNDLEKSSHVGVNDVEPMIYGIEKTNVFREDRAEKRISRETLLGNAPDKSDGYFKVPKTID